MPKTRFEQPAETIALSPMGQAMVIALVLVLFAMTVTTCTSTLPDGCLRDPVTRDVVCAPGDSRWDRAVHAALNR